MLNYDVIFSGVGAFDHLFSPGKEKFSKNSNDRGSCPGGCPGVEGC